MEGPVAGFGAVRLGALRFGAAAGVGLIALIGNAFAADLSSVLPTKAPPLVPMAYDWSGFYLGGHVGYGLGGSNWSATQAGSATPSLSGTVGFSNAYNFSSGTGSYLLGLQAGYDHMAASRWLVGVVADVSFPSFLGGTATLSTPLIGTANYLDRVEFSGSLRGRVGYAPNFGNGNWLFYATGGLAISYDQFTRTQLAGIPVGGTAVPGTIENAFLTPRVGGVAGAGVEVALASHWTAQFEYLFTDYGTRSVTFPAGAQRFDSDLTLSELRAGLNYRFNDDMSTSADKAVTPPALQTDNFAVHGQTTFLEQYDPPFHSPYTGTNSLIPNQGRETFDATAFLGWRLWDGAELWINPEIDQGFGLSDRRSALPDSPAAKPTRSVNWFPMRACRARLSGRRSILAATSRRLTRRPISSAARRLPTVSCSPSASSASPTYSTTTNTLTIRAATS